MALAQSTAFSDDDLSGTGDDFIDSFQMPTRWVNGHVEHERRVTDRSRGIRNAIIVDKWYRQKDLGRGGFGNVHLEGNQEGKLRAVKEVPKVTGRTRTIDYFREVLAMAHLEKEDGFFVKLEGWYQDEQMLHIAMEYFQHGDLSKCVTAPLVESEAQIITYQVIEALEFMHRKKFTHRDIKPNNVFVVSPAPNWWIKLGDFGVSKRVKSYATALYTSIETDYTAPEILGFVEVDDQSSSYTSAVDIWSTGCLCHWLLCQRLPLERRNMQSYCMRRSQLPRQVLDERGVSNVGIEFIAQLLRPRPQDRLSALDAASHPWAKKGYTSTTENEFVISTASQHSQSVVTDAVTDGLTTNSLSKRRDTKPFLQDTRRPFLRRQTSSLTKSLIASQNSIDSMILEIRVQAIGLPRKYHVLLPSTYATVWATGNASYRSEVIESSRDPEWTSSFLLRLQLEPCEVLVTIVDSVAEMKRPNACQVGHIRFDPFSLLGPNQREGDSTNVTYPLLDESSALMKSLVTVYLTIHTMCFGSMNAPGGAPSSLRETMFVDTNGYLLPCGWERRSDGAGPTYYYNFRSHATREISPAFVQKWTSGRPLETAS